MNRRNTIEERIVRMARAKKDVSAYTLLCQAAESY